MADRLRIIINLPYLYSVRDFLFTPVWEEMVKRSEVDFYILSDDTRIGELISKRKSSNVYFKRYPPQTPDKESFFENVARKLSYAFQTLDDKYLIDTVMYRFACINNLSHYLIRRNKSTAERKKHQVFYYYRKGESAGIPFPRNILLYKLLYNLRHSTFNFTTQRDKSIIKSINPDLFVIGRLHWYTTPKLARVMRELRIPMVGIVSSWDHPTTQGPTPRGMSAYIVASKRMADEMADLHGVNPHKIIQVGKVQMDVYKDDSAIKERSDFLRELRIPANHSLITFGTNIEGLKEHEISIARRLAHDFSKGRYGKATLLIRTHPQDLNWKEDFSVLANPPFVLCKNASSYGHAGDNLAKSTEDAFMLANLMKHSDIVIQSRGSLALDAIAFDTPVISLAFDGDLSLSHNDSFLLENLFEHYKPLVKAKGMWLVGSYESLDSAIADYLGDPTIHADGRKLIREECIEPLDGKSSSRLVDYLVNSAKKARQGLLQGGDWDYSGLGDVSWSSHQIIDVNRLLDI